ncbi:PREDICTED: calcium-transporting ATPase [Prunus dulcis]|uniref:PREDICTED: calcium-transporting ATPase n=1 Tax=Prunus dulcis TaxID=3755 RepID=A0A5E4F8R6_PRUDU|nr:hypothetical protein L3X38_022619 [Prunus dulcis]VVA22158.1 PREDICTED: calcium-transporting ATPase [Prunus dulcis]
MENPDEVMDLESQQTPPREVDDSYITGSHAASPEHGDVELPRTTDLSPVSPQVSKEVHVSVEDGGGGGGGDEAKQQHADLESGLVVDVDASSGPGVAPSFFKLLKKSCKSCNIFLLFISAVLSIGFGIKEEGTGTGWVEGAILMDAAIILVVLYAMREFWSGNTQHQAVSKTKAELLMAKIDKVCTCMQRIALVSYIAILTISFLHYMLERKDSNSGLPEIKGKATASTEIINVIENFFKKQSRSKSNMLAKLVLLLPAVVEKLPFSVALAIRYRRKKILPAEKANISQEMSALCTMRPAAICISTNVLTLNSRKVKMCYTGDEVIKEEPHALQALSNAIRTSVSTGSTSTENQLLPWTESSLGMEDENLGLNHTDEEDRENGDMWWYFKGPATTIIDKCSHYSDSKGNVNSMDKQNRMDYDQLKADMQSNNLKTIAFAYKKTNGQMLEENDMTLIALVGVMYNYDTDIMEAVEFWRKEGSNVILFSDDSAPVLEDVARLFGIVLPNSNKSVVEGERFRTSDKEGMMDISDKIYWMVNSTSSDKFLLVQCLKEKGQEVLMVGDRIDETPFLKEADVGVAIGTRSSEDPECCDIINMDGSDFGLVVKIIKFERCIYYTIQKYIQPEITMKIALLLITLIATICMGQSTITTIQSFWVEMVVTLTTGFALLMEPPTEEQPPPVRRTKGLNISNPMWRNILIQVAYQTAMLVTLQLKGKTFLGINQKVSESMVFNAFVLCQVFNQINARQPEKKNVFSGILLHPWFLVSLVFALTLQLSFIEIAHILVGNASLNWKEWGVCLLIGMGSWPIDSAGKCASDVIKKVRDSYLVDPPPLV